MRKSADASYLSMTGTSLNTVKSRFPALLRGRDFALPDSLNQELILCSAYYLHRNVPELRYNHIILNCARQNGNKDLRNRG